jgi:hypothetical protein
MIAPNNFNFLSRIHIPDMNMKLIYSILISLGILFNCYPAIADSNDSLKIKKIKIYLNSNYEQSEWVTNFSYYYTVDKEYHLSINEISVALEISNKQNISHEFELMPFTFNKGETKTFTYYHQEDTFKLFAEMNTYSFKTYAKYTMNYYFLNKNKKLRPFTGLSTGVFYNKLVTQPLTSTSYPSSIIVFYIPLYVVPGLDIKLSEVFGLTINFPVNINKVILDHIKIDNPVLSEKLRSSSMIYGILMPKELHFSFALNYLIGKNAK